MVFEVDYCRAIAFKAEACNGFYRRERDEGVLSEFLAGVDIGYVYLDRGNGHCFQCVENRNRGVSVGGGIDDDAVEFSVCLLDFVNYCTFVIGLEKLAIDAVFGAGVFDQRAESGKILLAVDVGLAKPQHIEIGAVYYKKFHFSVSVRLFQILIYRGGACLRRLTFLENEISKLASEICTSL